MVATRFICGEDALDRYFQAQVTQDIRRRITNCFMALTELPPEETKRLPRYPTPGPRFASTVVGWTRSFSGAGWPRRCR